MSCRRLSGVLEVGFVVAAAAVVVAAVAVVAAVEVVADVVEVVGMDSEVEWGNCFVRKKAGLALASCSALQSFLVCVALPYVLGTPCS